MVLARMSCAVQALIGDLGVPIHAQHLDGDAVYHDPGGMQRLDGNLIDVASGRFVGGASSLASGQCAQRTPEWSASPVRHSFVAVTHANDTVTMTTDAGRSRRSRRGPGAPTGTRCSVDQFRPGPAGGRCQGGARNASLDGWRHQGGSPATRMRSGGGLVCPAPESVTSARCAKSTT